MGGAPRYSSSPTCAPHVALLPFSSTSTIERWLMKRVGAAPCQCSSPGSKNTRSSLSDHLDRRAAPLHEANAFRDVDRLSVRMGVPRSSRARRESDAARAHARWTCRRRDRIDVRRTREPLARPRGGLDRVLGDPHDSTPDVVARLFRGPRQGGLLRARVTQLARHGPRRASPLAPLGSGAGTRHGHIARDSDVSR